MSCMCHRDFLGASKTGVGWCVTFKRLDLDRCCCHDFHDTSCPANLSSMLEQRALVALGEGHKRLDSVLKKSNLLHDPTIANKEMNRSHTDFEPRNREEKRTHSASLREELEPWHEAHGMTGFNALMSQPFEVKKSKLKELLADEVGTQIARTAVSHHDRVKCLIIGLAVENFIPCMLHMEMRANEKISFCLFAAGMDWCPDGDSATRNLCIDVVNPCMNTEMFGDPLTGGKGQWKLPLKDGGKQVEPRGMSV